MTPKVASWSAFDRELWACILGIRHFCQMLEGRQLVIFTIRPAQSQRPVDSTRQCRQLDYIAYQTSHIRYVAGVENVDTLSRSGSGVGGSVEIVPGQGGSRSGLPTHTTSSSCWGSSWSASDFPSASARGLGGYCEGRAVIVIPEDGKKSTEYRWRCSTIFWGIFPLSVVRTTVFSSHGIHSWSIQEAFPSIRVYMY